MDTLFHRQGKGKCEVLDFLDGLSSEELATVFDSIDKIKEFGIDTPRKFLEHLGSGIFAIRAREDHVQPRVMAFMFDGYLIATHGFKKKRGSIPEVEIKKTKTIKRHWEKNGIEILKGILGG